MRDLVPKRTTYVDQKRRAAPDARPFQGVQSLIEDILHLLHRGSTSRTFAFKTVAARNDVVVRQRMYLALDLSIRDTHTIYQCFLAAFFLEDIKNDNSNINIKCRWLAEWGDFYGYGPIFRTGLRRPRGGSTFSLF